MTATYLKPQPQIDPITLQKAEKIILTRPNLGKIPLLKIRAFLIRIAIPFFFLHFLAIKGLQLAGWTYGLCMLPVALLLITHYVLFVRKKSIRIKTTMFSLSANEIRMYESGRFIYKLPWDKLQVRLVGWGDDVARLLPALEIQGDNFPRIILGSTESTDRWVDYKKSVECADYLLETEADWKQLLRWLHPG